MKSLKAAMKDKDMKAMYKVYKVAFKGKGSIHDVIKHVRKETGDSNA